jgi:hypothetical protein
LNLRSLLEVAIVCLVICPIICTTTSASSDTSFLHDLPSIPDDAVPLWEREYLMGTGNPVFEVINIGKTEVTFSLWKTPPNYFEGYHLTQADYVISVNKGENVSMVVDPGYYLYWAAEMPYETSSWWSGSNVWFERDCHYKAIFPDESNRVPIMQKPLEKSAPGFSLILGLLSIAALLVLRRG